MTDPVRLGLIDNLIQPQTAMASVHVNAIESLYYCDGIESLLPIGAQQLAMTDNITTKGDTFCLGLSQTDQS